MVSAQTSLSPSGLEPAGHSSRMVAGPFNMARAKPLMLQQLWCLPRHLDDKYVCNYMPIISVSSKRETSEFLPVCISFPVHIHTVNIALGDCESVLPGYD